MALADNPVTPPPSIAAGLGVLTANLRDDASKPGDVVYFGNIPWNLLDKAYDTGASSDPATGYLFLSKYLYNGGTQWKPFRDNSHPDDGTGYLTSDVRTYLTGTGTYTAFQSVGAYAPSESSVTSYYHYYWERNTNTDAAPVTGRVYYTKSAAAVYTSVRLSQDKDWKAGVWYTKDSGEAYTLSQAEDFAAGTYYRDDTPYDYAGTGGEHDFSFAEGTTYYYFTKPTSLIKAQDSSTAAGANLARAYYYAGCGITTKETQSSTEGTGPADDAYRMVGGRTPAESGVSFAADHGISAKELTAIAPVSRAAVAKSAKYTVKTGSSKMTYDYYGDALNGDTFFLLSGQEAAPMNSSDDGGYWTTKEARKGYHEGGKYYQRWWLRSSAQYGTNPGYVNPGGDLNGSLNSNSRQLGVRPAFVLDPAAVLFASASGAGEGKAASTAGTANGDAFVKLAEADTSTWKLTLKDDSLTLEEVTVLADDSDGEYTVYYQGASMSGEHIYVSAILTDVTGESIYGYTKLAKVDSDAAKSGHGSFTLPDELTLKDSEACKTPAKLKVFLEQTNGGTATDYAGTPKDLTPKALSSIAITAAPTTTTYIAQTAFDPAGMVVTATYGENGSTFTRDLGSNEYTVSYPTSEYAGNLAADQFHIKSDTATKGTLTDAGESQTVTISFGGQTATQTVTVKGIAQAEPTEDDFSVEKTESGVSQTKRTGNTPLQTSENDDMTDASDYVTAIINDAGTDKMIYVRYKAHGDYAPGTVRAVILPAKETTYKVTISLTKDGDAWSNSGITYKLVNNSSGTSYENYDGSAIVAPGTYSVWATNGDALADTTVDVTVNNEHTEVTIPYVTATFHSNITGKDNVTTPVLSGVAYTTTDEESTMTTYANEAGLTFTGFNGVTDNTITITEAKAYTAQYGISSAAVTVVAPTKAETLATNVTCGANTYTGAVVWYKGDSVSGSPVSGNAEAGTVYTAQITLTPGSGMSFASSTSVSVNNGTAQSVSPAEHGNLVVKKTFSATAKESAAVVQAPGAATLTYNGSAQELVSAGTAAGGTMQYSTTQSGSYSTAIPTGTDAGSYTVWYKVVGDAYHTDTTPDKVDVTIDKKALSVAGMSWTGSSPFTFDGTEKSMTLSGDLPTGVTVTKTGDKVSAAGSYTAKAEFALASGYSADNYQISGTNPLTADWTINKATPTGEPDCVKITSSGKTLADAPLTIGTITPIGGTLAWNDGAATEVKANTAYGWTYTPTDTANYHTLTGEMKPYAVSTGAGSSKKPSASVKPSDSVKPTEDKTVEVKTEATVRGGEAKAEVSDKTITSALTVAAKDDATTSIVIATQVKGNADKVIVELSKSAVADIADKSNLAVTVGSGVADVTIANAGLAELAKEAGSKVAVSAEKTAGGAVKVEVAVGGKAIDTVFGGLTVAAHLAEKDSGNVLVLVNEDGTESIIRKSIVDDETAKAVVDGSCTVKVVDNRKDFTDVKEDAWYSSSVVFASSHELFNGMSDTQFAPEMDMSRAMLVTVLFRLEDAAATGAPAFTDVPAHAYYADAVAWASGAGIVKGYGDGIFGSHDPITRQNLATMLYRYAGAIGMDTSARGNLDDFNDAKKVSGYAEEAMRWAVGSGIIGSKGNGVLDPTGSATRAEVAAMLQQLVKIMVK